jgi:hypothetical protein
MEILQNFWICLLVFLGSLLFILYTKRRKKDEVEAQFVVTTGCLVFVFYAVCFLSGICSILNFIKNFFI